MSNGKYLIIVFSLPFIVGYVIFVTVQFKGFCGKIAFFENRLDQLNDIRRDEGGLNWFELEVFGKIAGRRYDDIDDLELRQAARDLRKQLTGAYVVAFILIVLLVATLS